MMSRVRLWQNCRRLLAKENGLMKELMYLLSMRRFSVKGEYKCGSVGADIYSPGYKSLF